MRNLRIKTYHLVVLKEILERLSCKSCNFQVILKENSKLPCIQNFIINFVHAMYTNSTLCNFDIAVLLI